ncbi:PleD family two-component system response regulator [candidate division KSB1 bacterium]
MKKILIIDDDEDIVKLFIDNLQLYNYSVIGVSDGRKAMEKVRQWKPDLVILDILLPFVHGFSICQEIKSDDELKYIHVIFVSAKSYESDIKKAYEIGAEGFIPKPFKWEDVLDKLEELLSEN